MIRRLTQAFSPATVPLMARPCYRHEIVTASTLPVAVSTVAEEWAAVGIYAIAVITIIGAKINIIGDSVAVAVKASTIEWATVWVNPNTFITLQGAEIILVRNTVAI